MSENEEDTNKNTQEGKDAPLTTKTITADKILYRRPITIETAENGEGSSGIMTLVKDKTSGDVITGVTHVVITIPATDVITAQVTYAQQDAKTGEFITENNDFVLASVTAPVAGIKLSALESSYYDLSERASVQAMLVRPDIFNTAFGAMCTAFQIEAEGHTIRLTPAEIMTLGAYILSNQKEINTIVEINKKPPTYKKKSDIVVPSERPKPTKRTKKTNDNA